MTEIIDSINTICVTRYNERMNIVNMLVLQKIMDLFSIIASHEIIKKKKKIMSSISTENIRCRVTMTFGQVLYLQVSVCVCVCVMLYKSFTISAKA